MSASTLTQAQEDALQELANIAMGRAGHSLATTLGSLVSLSVPRARIVEAADSISTLQQIIGPGERVSTVRQAFFDMLNGEALVIYGIDGCTKLADLLGHDQALDEAQQCELLLDVSNLLVGAVLAALGEQLDGAFGYTRPEVIALRQPVYTLLGDSEFKWSHALLLEVNFALEAHGFRCHLVLLMPEQSIDLMLTAVARLLADL